MTTYKGGDTVRAGFYWNWGKWGAEIVPPEGGTLPGNEGTTYNRIPWPALLVAAPVMGGAFAMFLPFIGVAMLMQFGYRAITGRRGSPRGAGQTGSRPSDYERAA
jgi:hypothetical protein